MSNILQHNRKIFDVKLDKSNYWDFHLCIDKVGSYNNTSDCLSAEIDFNDNECVWFDEIYSKNNVTWSDAISEDITLNSIGLTGVDSGLFVYEKDKITNKEFLDIFLNSHYNIFAEDKRLKLKKINGNNQLYNYDNDIVILDSENIQVSRLNGGFYQGFFKLDGYNYQTMPTSMGQNGWTFSFDLKKENFENKNLTLNKIHPQNKGIFFFIGTRAENKWYKHYNNIDNEIIKKTNFNYNEDYSNDYNKKENANDMLSYQTKDDTINEGEYFEDNYVKNNEYFDAESDCCEYYTNNEYIETDEVIPNEKNLKTEEGYDMYQPNIIEYKTDNKFITFNRTKNGFTTKDNINNSEVILYDIKVPNMENYFLLFNRTCDGFTTKNINELVDVKNKEYKILNDIYRNALAFQITDEGKIGYKYLVKDCDKENEYKIESEFSNVNIIEIDKWYNIKVIIRPIKNKSNRCQNSNNAEMRFYFYVNNKLVLVSKILPILKLNRLNDICSKQEGVPYNISIGGGTQGLCDVINVNYMETPTDILPIEKEFAGSFIGYLKNFKFYDC